MPWIGVGGGWAFPSSEHFPGGQGPRTPQPRQQGRAVSPVRGGHSCGRDRAGPWGAERRTQQKEPAWAGGACPEEPRHREEVAVARGQTRVAGPLHRGGPAGAGEDRLRPSCQESLGPPPLAAQARGTFGSAAGGEGGAP